MEGNRAMEKKSIPPIQMMPEMRWIQRLRILKTSTRTPGVDI
jgi:hypothetical protein